MELETKSWTTENSLPQPASCSFSKAESRDRPTVNIVVMEGIPTYAVCLATLPVSAKLKVLGRDHRTQYLFLDKEIAENPSIRDSLPPVFGDEFTKDSQILALAAIEPVSRYHPLLEVSVEEQLQRDAWAFISSAGLAAKLYFFCVVKLEVLPSPLPVEIVASQFQRSFFGLIKESWSQHVLNTNALGLSARELCWWKSLCRSHFPRLLLRMPRATLCKVRNLSWTRIAVPEFPESFALRVGWKTFQGEKDPEVKAAFISGEPMMVIALIQGEEQGAAGHELLPLAKSSGRLLLRTALRDAASAVMGCIPWQGAQRERLLSGHRSARSRGL